jgi:hypothetical protein|tara:strand:+ start:111 stop:314 length:204 start_codon:yes stop_codon:yes gene_type:complete
MKRYNQEYPAPSSQPAGVKVEPMSASAEGFAQAKEVSAGKVIDGKETKIKGGGAATKGLNFYRYISD